jgi:hypothetical protein
MRRECPDCRTVTGGSASYCGSCGWRFRSTKDPIRRMADRSRKELGLAALTGFMVAVMQYLSHH